MDEHEHRTDAYSLALRSLDDAARFLNEHADLALSPEGIAARATALILLAAVRAGAAALHEESAAEVIRFRESERWGLEHRCPMTPGECGVPLMNCPCVLPEGHGGSHSERIDPVDSYLPPRAGDR